MLAILCLMLFRISLLLWSDCNVTEFQVCLYEVSSFLQVEPLLAALSFRADFPCM